MSPDTEVRLAIAVRCWFTGHKCTALAMLDLLDLDGAP